MTTITLGQGKTPTPLYLNMLNRHAYCLAEKLKSAYLVYTV